MITIYTDGSSRGNPGPGGYGTILKYGDQQKELSEGFRKTTNNRMELLAVIKGLEAIKKPGWKVLVVSDSKYVIDSITKGWLSGWVKKNFKGKKNRDLWERYLAVQKHHDIRFQWVKGHAGHPENERCDQLAVEAAEGMNLKVDEAFETSENRD
ncbi:MAG: ribonuclease HI [Bacteroidota bacterium]